MTVSKVFRGVDIASGFRPVRVMSVDDYFFQDGRELSQRALACGEDTGCLADALAVFRADLGLVVIANTDVTPPLLGLILIDTAERAVLADSYATLHVGAIEPQVAASVDAIFDSAGLLKAGRLEVLAEPAEAIVQVDEQSSPDLDGAHRFTLSPGRYLVKATAPEHQPDEREVQILPGETIRLEIRLDPQQPLWKSPWLWGSVAAVVIAAGTITIFAVANESSNDCLCVTAAGDPNCLTCP